MDFINAFTVSLQAVVDGSGFVGMTGGNIIMIVVGLILLYLAFARDFEPLLLSPIAFGCILANIPFNGFEEPGVMSAIGMGIKYEIFPPLIFLGVGAMTDFGPLIARPRSTSPRRWHRTSSAQSPSQRIPTWRSSRSSSRPS